MTTPTVLEISETAFDAMTVHALETYPEECCGIVLSAGGHDEVRPLANIQNALHERDPETFPRDARTAYTMDHRALDALLAEADRRGLRIKAFYHSHPDHDAYFSAEDRAFATPFGEPTFPDAAQVVISVMRGTVANVGVYVWSAATQDFVGGAIDKVPDR